MNRVCVVCWIVLAFLFVAPVAVGAPAKAPVPTPQTNPHEQLHEILQRPLYQRWQLRQEQNADSPIGQDVRRKLESWSKWLSDWIDSLFRSRPAKSHSSVTTPSLGGGLVTFFWVIAWIAIALFVLALIVLIVRLVRANSSPLTTGHVLSREQVAAALRQGDALAMAGDQWLDEASRLAADKNFRAMYRALYLALLSGLHAQGKIDFNRHHTNWTYVSRYRGEPAQREIFSALTSLFDRVWYGLNESNHDDLPTLKAQVEQLIQPAATTGDARAN